MVKICPERKLLESHKAYKDEHCRILGGLCLYQGNVDDALRYYSMITNPHEETKAVAIYLSQNIRRIRHQKLKPRYIWREYVGTRDNPGSARELFRYINDNARIELIFGTAGGLTIGAFLPRLIEYLRK